MNRNNLILVIAVAGLLAASFLAGYQMHEPRVVTETNTVTEVQTVEVPEVVTQTETEVEKISVPTDDVKSYVDNSDQYAVMCSEYYTNDKQGGVAVDLNNSDIGRLSANDGEVVFTIDDRIVIDDDKLKPPIEKFDELVEEECGISPEENVERENVYEGDGQ